MTMEELKRVVAELAPHEKDEFLEWCAELREDAWDEQIARDASTGRLDALAKRASAEYKAGKTKPL